MMKAPECCSNPDNVLSVVDTDYNALLPLLRGEGGAGDDHD